MIVNKTYRITTLTMALLMFFSSVGFSIDFHYCKGEFKSLSLIGKAKSCHEGKKVCRHHTKDQNISKKDNNCCSNNELQVQSWDKDFTQVAAVEFSDLSFKIEHLSIITLSYTSPPKVVRSTFLKDFSLSPPMDIYVLLERFLI